MGLVFLLTATKKLTALFKRSLPIWNFVLPAYAFLHMDDFTWGQTRQVAGEIKGGAGHDEKEGKFDSSNIVMKRWADWERDRRYRAYSRDLSFASGFPGDVHGGPRRSGSNRGSFISSADTFASGLHDMYAARRASGLGPPVPSQIELPAPLASAPSSFTGDSSSNEAAHPSSDGPFATSSSDESHPSRTYARGAVAAPRVARAADRYPRQQLDDYDSDDIERDPMLSHGSPRLDSPIMDSAAFASPSMSPSDRDLPTLPPAVVDPTATTASQRNTNPFTNLISPVSPSSSEPSPVGQPKRRGVSLVDDGPVPGTDGFRPIQRSTRRQSSTAGTASSAGARPRQSGAFDSTYSSSGNTTGGGTLPPGAAPPRHV